MNFSSITQRFIAWFLLISLLPLLLVGYILLRTFETELQQTVTRNISSIADKKVDQIDNYLQEHAHDALVKTQANSTRLAMAGFAHTYARNGVESAAYRRLDASYRDHFKRFVATAGYYDLFLISTQGTVVYSQAHEADFATNLFNGPYRNTGLAKVTRNALSTLESAISEYEPYAPSGSAIAAFIAVPIMNNGKLEGVLALQIDNARVYQVLSDNTGLGISGETLVAMQRDDHTALVVAPLKSDPDAALKFTIPLNDAQRPVPLVHAMAGERGSGYGIDYQGKSVVAAWRYLPRMKWGMVVKMDTAEALAPLYRARNFGLTVIGVALFVALLGALLFGRRVIMPLKLLSNSAREIAAGKFGQTVPVIGRDELAQLAASFNTMAERLQPLYTELGEKVKQRTARLDEAQRIAKLGSWELNLLTGELVWSDEIFRLFEIDKNKFEASYEAFLNSIHPEDRDKVNLAYTGSLKDKKPYGVTHRLLMGDGRIKWVEERCETDFDADGKPLISRGTIQDITQQKLAEDLLHQSETRYQSVVSALAEGIVLNAKDGSIIAANESAQKILGLSWDQMKGLTPLDPRWRAIHEDGTPFTGDAHPIAVTLRTGKPQSNVIMGVHKPDGNLTWISVNSQPIFQAGETLPSTVVVSFVDITARKNAEEMLQNTNEELERRVELRTKLLHAAKEEAEQASKSKSLFLTSMSHELRTPLNAILGYSQLMQMDNSLPQTVIENAAEIKRAGDVLLSLMNDILDLARIESGKLQLQIEVIPVAGVIETCYSHNIQAAISHNLTLHMSESCTSYHVSADQRGLLQVLNNLVSNAIKYNREGGRINVSCAAVAGGKVRVSVSDTGLGIAPDKQSQLFQSFNRLGAEMSNIEGTGIGLVIARKLVEGMHGLIGFESVHGTGSTFWVELPVDKNANASLPGGAAQDQSVAEPKKVPHVLVAEDYIPNQNVLLLQLQTMGCDVDIASEGKAALNMWRKKSYDLILTDIDMPVMNGTELAQAVRTEERGTGGRIPIVAITAINTASELKRYKSAGIDEVLSKPLSMDVLRKGMTRWFGDISSTPSRQHAEASVHTTGSKAPNAILDLNYLYQILGQVDLVQARILIDTFMRTADEGLKYLSMQMNNAAVVAKEMHKQKSSARTVGALRYANLAAQLEQQTRDENFANITDAMAALREALTEVEAASANLLESPRMPQTESATAVNHASVACHTALVVDDDLVVLQQVKTMLAALGAEEVLTAVNGLEATKLLATRVGDIEVLVCDLSMPEMDGVELIRRIGKLGFKGGLILISGADEKIISTVNKLAVLQGLRVLGQLQKPVSAAQLAILLAHTSDLPAQKGQAIAGPAVSRKAIRAAMNANEFSIWFQPKVDAATLSVVGMEALARWQLPSGKFIPPDSFITVAEREGLIGELSQMLVSLSLTEAAKLFGAGFPLKIAINLSGTWLNDLSLPDFILSKTRMAGLRATDVILEVTETGVMEDLTTALDVLSRLRLKGFGLSIDDFGIGYSSFEQLGRIPFTEMKLDRSFVNKGVEDSAARAILESSMDMAHKLNLSTVAEGVETELDLKLVRSLGCDLVQGYFIAKPMPVNDLLVWLNNEKNKKGT